MLKNIVLKKFLKGSVFKLISIANKCISKRDDYILLYSGNKGISFNLLPLRDYLLNNGYSDNNTIICGIEDNAYAENDECTYVTHLKAILFYLRSKYVFYTAGQLPIKPSKQQKVIHLQHGIMFKNCGLLTKINNGDEFFFTDCLATSNLYKPIYSKVFGCKESNVYINSEPVTDIFFSKYEKYNLGNFGKIILWVPTFRQSDYLGYDDSTSEELLPLFDETDYEELNKQLANHSYKLIVKIHPSQNLGRYRQLCYSNLEILSDADFKNMGMDLYNLLPQIDVLLTDYSSLFLQFLLLDKPVAFVIPDIEVYSQRRGFVFNNTSEYMPGEKIKTKADFFRFLDCMKQDKFKDARQNVRNKIHKYADGKSCDRLIKYCGITK